MKNNVTIITYHFVRDILNSRYPELKGVEVNEFREQVIEIKKKYHVITVEELMESISNNYNLPKNSLLLTFDDGYKDHFNNVFPIMYKYKIQASFFPTAKTVFNSKMLEVNKIQLILASVPQKNEIIKSIFSIMDEYRSEYSLKDNEYYYSNFAKKWRFDSAEVIFIKRMLQKELHENLKTKIVDRLFKKYIDQDEKEITRDLYMNLDELKYMHNNGMYIGGHGYHHYWLGTLDQEKQKKEIDHTLDLLRKIGTNINQWVMCYPYGSYNNELISLLKQKKCKIGLAMKLAIADLYKDNPMALPRLRPNDLF